jgi:hypothetical protein
MLQLFLMFFTYTVSEYVDLVDGVLWDSKGHEWELVNDTTIKIVQSNTTYFIWPDFLSKQWF